MSKRSVRKRRHLYEGAVLDAKLRVLAVGFPPRVSQIRYVDYRLPPIDARGNPVT